MSVIVALFNSVTEVEWRKGGMTQLNNRVRTNYPAGTIVVLANYEAKYVIGVGVMANWGDSDSPCREHHLLDQDTYSGENAKHNKWDICITGLRLLKNLMNFSDIRTLVGGDIQVKKARNNMWTGCRVNFAKVFGQEAAVKRYKLWVHSLL
jgi:hypothetical protein